MRIRYLLLLVMAATVLGGLGVPWQARAAAPAAPLAALLPVPGTCVERPALLSSAQHRFCVPSSGWNGDVVVWAHGFSPIAEYQDTLPDDTSLPTLVQKLGFAFASTTYPSGGLVLGDAATDLVSLRNEFFSLYASQKPRGHTIRAYLTGASMGGLIVAKLAEDPVASTFFSGALPACGLVGSLGEQVGYWRNFIAQFDLLFPGVFASAFTPPPAGPTDSAYIERIVGGMGMSVAGDESLLRLRLAQLIAATKAPIDPKDPGPSTIATVAAALYYGSLLTADPGAVSTLLGYEATGKTRIPMVLMHTKYDPVVLSSQSRTYAARALRYGKLVPPIVVERYGHCNFTGPQVMAGFLVLVLRVNGGLVLPFLAETAGTGATTGDPEVDAVLQSFKEYEAQASAWQPVYLPQVFH